MHVNRREFLRKSICAALGGASAYSACGSLSVMAAAARQNAASFDDYKALVCIFLYGGNDSFNTIVPYDATYYPQYLAARNGLAANGGLAFAQPAIQANALIPLTLQAGFAGGPASDGGSYGLHPSMPEIRDLFNNGRAAIVANVGTLIYPMTQLAYRNGSVTAPPQLLSHVDQQNQWQTSRSDDASANGWGGRVADLLYSANSGQVPMSISLSGNNQFQRGAIVSQYSMNSYDKDNLSGITAMNYLGDGPESWIVGDAPIMDDTTAYNALIHSVPQMHLLEQAYANSATHAISNYQIVGNALASSPALTTQFPETDLGSQLAQVARLINVRSALGMSRQVFFVSTGNYDTHSGQIDDQQSNLSELSQALNAFYSATVELNIADSVTAFTASDFGRSLEVNNTGTDHGWGGHHFVVGGAVRGARFYGAMPSLLTDGNPDDTGGGQIIPTLAVDQYAATLATWFGVSPTDLTTVFPNLGRFDSLNLGFLG